MVRYRNTRLGEYVWLDKEKEQYEDQYVSVMPDDDLIAGWCYYVDKKWLVRAPLQQHEIEVDW